MISILYTLLIVTFSLRSVHTLPAPSPTSHQVTRRAFDQYNALDHYMKWDDASGTYTPDMTGMNDLMVGDTDGNGNRKPRQNCIFYVNQRPPMNDNDPNWAKKRAVQFAALMNLAIANGDYHTLYEVYNLDDAFRSESAGPMADALEAGLKRVWFQTTSEAFANLCEGTVYLVAEEEEIWDGAIWLTNEVNALFRSGAITEILEVRPADIGNAYDHGGSLYQIPTHPYRGGQPPGAKPPRDGDSVEVPANTTRPDPNNIDLLKQLQSLNNLDTEDPGDQPPVGQNKTIPKEPKPSGDFSSSPSKPSQTSNPPQPEQITVEICVTQDGKDSCTSQDFSITDGQSASMIQNINDTDNRLSVTVSEGFNCSINSSTNEPPAMNMPDGGTFVLLDAHNAVLTCSSS